MKKLLLFAFLVLFLTDLSAQTPQQLRDTINYRFRTRPFDKSFSTGDLRAATLPIVDAVEANKANAEASYAKKTALSDSIFTLEARTKTYANGKAVQAVSTAVETARDYTDSFFPIAPDATKANKTALADSARDLRAFTVDKYNYANSIFVGEGLPSTANRAGIIYRNTIDTTDFQAISPITYIRKTFRQADTPSIFPVAVNGITILVNSETKWLRNLSGSPNNYTEFSLVNGQWQPSKGFLTFSDFGAIGDNVFDNAPVAARAKLYYQVQSFRISAATPNTYYRNRIVITSGVYRFSSDVSINWRADLDFQGGIFSPDTLKTITFGPAPIYAPANQIFAGNGKIVFQSDYGRIVELRPEWWAATNAVNGSTASVFDDYTPVQDCIDAAPWGGIIRFSQFNYRFGKTLKVTKSLIMQGSGMWGTMLTYIGQDGGNIVDVASTCTYFQVKDLRLENTGNAKVGVYTSCSRFLAENIAANPIQGFSTAVMGTDTTVTTYDVTYKNCHITSSAIGKENRRGIWLGRGHTHRVLHSFFEGNTTNIEAGTATETVGGATIFDTRFVSSGGLSVGYPGALEATSILVTNADGINILANNMELSASENPNDSLVVGIRLVKARGGNIDGNNLTGNGQVKKIVKIESATNVVGTSFTANTGFRLAGYMINFPATSTQSCTISGNNIFTGLGVSNIPTQ